MSIYVTYEEKCRFLDAFTTFADSVKEIARKMPEPKQEQPSRHHTQLGAIKRISATNDIINMYLNGQFDSTNIHTMLEDIQKTLNDLYPA